MQIQKEYLGKSGVYFIKNVISGKQYVGSSKNIYHRLHRHKCDLLKNRHANSHLQNSFNKNGIDSFYCDIIKFCSIGEMVKLEQECIDSKLFEFNQNLSATTTILSHETRIIIGKTLKQMYVDGSMIPTKTRAINMFNSDGVFIKRFNTIKSASIELNIYLGLIVKVLKKYQKHTHGFQFRYVEDENPVDKLILNKLNNSTRIKKVKPFKKKYRFYLYDIQLYVLTEFNRSLDICNLLGITLRKLHKICYRKTFYKERYKIIIASQ